jgi:hypothetical protein
LKYHGIFKYRALVNHHGVCKYRASLKYHAWRVIAVLIGSVGMQCAWPAPLSEAVTHSLAHDIFKQLIEINTTDSVGSTTVAAQAMAQRLLEAGFPAADVTVLGPNERKGNMVARYRGKPGSKRKPILIIGHLDVVEARREDWSTDPFEFVEQDGYYYGRGSQDMKVSDAIAVTDFIRMKREGFVPDRDIILALTADEEGGKSNGVDWLLKNHRELIDAEFALNPDAGQVRSSMPITRSPPPTRAATVRCRSRTMRSIVSPMRSASSRRRRFRSS